MFRFWSQKVLPLVYDNSLSYYEVLCKLAAKVDEVYDAVAQTGFVKKTGDITQGTYFMNAPTVDPGNGTIIVNQNDAEENSVIRVQNTGNGYGFMMRVSRSGNRGLIDSSAIVAEDGTKTASNGTYKWIIYKDAENRVRIPDSLHALNCGNLFQAPGTGESTTLVADAMTQVQLTGTDAIRTAIESDFYEIVNGGVKVTQGGIYKVSGSVYMTGSTAGGATSKDAYIRKGTDNFDSAVEVTGASDNIYTGDQQGAHSNVNITPKLVYASANDIFFLGCRIRSGAGSFNPSVSGTFLLIERVG